MSTFLSNLESMAFKLKVRKQDIDNQVLKSKILPLLSEDYLILYHCLRINSGVIENPRKPETKTKTRKRNSCCIQGSQQFK